MLQEQPIKRQRAWALPGVAPTDAVVATILAAVVLVVLLSTRPLVGVPRNDDFSYARTAQTFATSGRIVYNGWASPLILPQTALGALVIKTVGFSYDALSVIGLLCAPACAGAMFLLARACGCSPFAGTIATTLLTLNPIFLSVAPSFMTDIPSLLLLLLALLFLVNAAQRRGGEESNGFDQKRFVISVALGLLAGANRQIIWLAFLGALAVVAMQLPQARRAALLAGALIVLVAAWLSRWFAQQPYTIVADAGAGLAMLMEATNVAFVFIYKFLNLLGLFLFPLAFAAFVTRPGRPRFLLLFALGAFCLLPVFYQFRTKGLELIADRYHLTYYGQYFSSLGVLVGGVHGFSDRPPVFGKPVITVLVLLGAVGMTLSGYLFFDWWEARGGDKKDERVRADVGVSVVAVASAIQVVVSVPWYAVMNVFDRYLLLILPGFLILHAAQWTRHNEQRGRRAAVAAPVVLFALVLGATGWAYAAEYMAYARARGVLYQRLLSRGVARTHIDGGFELNADTQVATHGFMNNPLMGTPPAAYRPDAKANHVLSYSPELYPVIDARFLLSTVARPDAALVLPNPVDQETYLSALPPFRRAMYVYRIRRDDDAP